MIKNLLSKCPCKLIQDPPRISSASQYTMVAIVLLVVLRLAIGFHFFIEGANKLTDGKFSAVGFLQNAKGPFAGFFRSYLKDADGLQRLNYNPHSEKWDKIEVELTLSVWAVHKNHVMDHYGFGNAEVEAALQRIRDLGKERNDPKNANRVEEINKQIAEARQAYGSKAAQNKAANGVFAASEARLKVFFLENGDDINEYFRDLERVKEYRSDPQREQVDSRRGQTDKIERDFRGKRGGWLKQIDTMWKDFDRSLHQVSTPLQWKQRGPAAELELPGSVGATYAYVDPNAPDPNNAIALVGSGKFMDVDCINGLIPRMDLLIGILLVLGLFTRATSIVAAMFLGSIMLTQWPWAAGALPTHNQAVEAIALVTLAIAGAGRFYGLDFFIVNWRRCCSSMSAAKATDDKDNSSNETSGDSK